MEKKEHWLKTVLLGSGSDQESERIKAWAHIAMVTGKEQRSFSSLADAIAQMYSSYCDEKEKEEFLQELARMAQFSKSRGLSLEAIDTLLLVVAIIGKMDVFAEKFAHSFVLVHRNAKERSDLAAMFLTSCDGIKESKEVYRAIMYLVQNKWMPRQYVLDACVILFETNPSAWFNTFATMLPLMSRYKNKLIREEGEAGRKFWSIAEKYLLGEIKSLEMDS